ncbi:MAG: hypothetical protein LBG76_00640 [Treponema sp.]|nr:hypothetical protein [Treponema sp.]
MMKLRLCAPLVYIGAGGDAGAEGGAGGRETPFVYEPSLGEVLRAFQLDPREAESIEPASDAYLEMEFYGRIEIPAGYYLFTQQRENLDRNGWLEMAIELQKDGLWERYVLEPRLYIRYLWEDARVVTQVFRPLREGSVETA